MQAVEIMGTIDERGQLLLDEPLEIDKPSRVKIILLIPDDDELESEDSSIEAIQASLKRALTEVKEQKTRPISELWTRIDD
jgi:hypothetical protein